MKKFLLGLVLLIVSALNADAATCFWVGGTGGFDSVNTASWASGTGGTPGTCAATGGIPKNAADTATFDGSSGGGTVTVCTALTTTCPSGTGSLAITQITMGAFTGTIDFSAINPNVALQNFSGTGTGTRTLNMGSGTWTMSGGFNSTTWDMSVVTNFTFNANTSTLAFSATGANNPRDWQSGGKTYNTVTIAEGTSGFTFLLLGSPTIASLTLTAPLIVEMSVNGTLTITSSLTATGTAYNNAIMLSPQNLNSSGTTISKSSGTFTCSWCILQKMTFSGGATFNATNSFNLGGNTGITITGPSGGATGGSVIGGF